MRLYTILIILLFVLGSGHGLAGQKHMKKMFAELNLTEEQQKQVKAVHQEMKLLISEARDNNKVARDAFMNAAKDPNKGDDELRQLHETMVSAKTSMMRLRFDKMIKTRAILNPEQKAKFQELSKLGGHGKRKHGPKE